MTKLLFMRKTTMIKIMKWSSATLLLLIVVLGIHIYMVTKPRVDAHTVVMARIDIKQPIDQEDADKITSWLYTQKGINHVLCNAKTDIVIFTFYPIVTSANQIVSNFKNDLNYKAERFMPSEKDLKSGCPVAATSMTYKIYNFIKHIF